MKKNNKKWILLATVLLLFTAYFARVITLNVTTEKNNVIRTTVGGTITENAYEYTVHDYNILSPAEFEETYDTKIDNKLFAQYEDAYILTVDMSITKKETTDTRIYKYDIYNICAQTLTYSQGFSAELFTLLNTESMSFKNDSNTIRIKLPYFFVKDVLSEKTWENFKNCSLKISLNEADNCKKKIILHE